MYIFMTKTCKEKLDATPFYPLLCFDSSLHLWRARAAHSAATGWRTSIFVGLLKKNARLSLKLVTYTVHACWMHRVTVRLSSASAFISDLSGRATRKPRHMNDKTLRGKWSLLSPEGPQSSRHCSWLICKQNPLVHAWCSWLWDTSEESRCSGYTQRMGVSCPWKGSPETLASSAPAIWALSSQSCERQSEHTSGMESAGRLWFAPFFSQQQCLQSACFSTFIVQNEWKWELRDLFPMDILICW